MAQQVVVGPDGRKHRFPAEASPQAIQAALRQIYPQMGRKGYSRAYERAQRAAAQPGAGVGPTEMLFRPVYDELAGAGAFVGQSAENMIRSATGRPIDVPARAAYEATRDLAKRDADAFARERPGMTLGAEVLGGLATGSPVRGAGRALTVAQSPVGRAIRGAGNIAKGGLFGGAYMTGYNAADAAPGERLQTARETALPSVATGAALTGGLMAAAPVARRLTQTLVGGGQDLARKAVTPRGAPVEPKPYDTERAARFIEDLMANQGVTPEALTLSSQRAFGKPITAAEAIGPHGVTHLETLGRRGAAKDLEAAMVKRVEAMPTRVAEDMRRTVGVSPGNAEDVIEGIVEAGQARVAPLFERALSDPGPLMTRELAEIASRPTVQAALKQVYKNALDAGEQPAARGLRLAADGQSVELVAPTRATWDAVRKAMGGQVERNPITGRPLPDTVSPGNYGVSRATSDLSGALRREIDGYSEALDASADYLRVRGAFQRARGSLMREKPRDFARRWGSITSPEERQAVRAAMAADIEDLIQKGALRPRLFRQPGVRSNIEVAFGKTRGRALINRLEAEAEMISKAPRLPRENSATSGAMMAASEQDRSVNALSGLYQYIRRRSSGGLFGIADVLDDALRYASSAGMPPEVRQEAARLLLMQPDELAAFVRQREAELGRARPRASVSSLAVPGMVATSPKAYEEEY